ncbi:prophage tail fiber N-terminal domain-containing protein [Escherichia coli]|uniref:prophage tail fiber N-terminal domain-containing protein n=1 Tax=Escherichia coli TaxID=562 RepID=UPI002284298A|nr:prophage tail fiber N-terminal domain-containing protein [Escherichia coli]MCZ0324544.1 prophage tail fiber N-terminal domain-containing protein [Escherichia coli]MCZ0329973.1 prophage tail fiber N-terminal domain-containing protein [Escherichia coli]HDG1086827.1 prophage tail fiber N-terminal domain-containing protein [Escherichia coli]HDW2447367.1 prophage tail fiber N-terminal domain-containing protein [Escherichia coli]
MSVVISGALIDGAGIPMSGCHIILKSRVNTSEVVMRTVADVVTGNCGEYCFKAQTGKYCVYLKQDWRDEYCVGDIAVYDDSRPGTLNDFLTALDEGDLKPDVVKRFEEMVAQAQQSAEAAAESEQQAGQHVADAQQIKSDCETLADNVQQNAESVAEDKKQVAQLASSATQDAARAEQAVKDVDKIVQKAVDKLDEAATLTGEAKASAEAAAKSEQSAKQHRDEAQRIVDDLKGTNASTTQKGLVQLCSDTDNDSEELAATPKAVKAVMDETKTKAPLDSPAFTGTPTTPTPPDDAVGLEMANVAFVRKLLAALVDSSPEALDTLNELAAALGNDPNFATTITNALAGKQPLNDVLTAVSQITPEENTLPYFSAEGRILLAKLSEKARSLLALDTPEAMRTELELKAAATMEPQSDIRDRTSDRVALPGAFGFGYAFSQSERLDFNSDEKFLEWVKSATDGRYFVYSYNSNLFPDGDSFMGIVDVKLFPSGMSTGNPAETDKGLFFYSRYQPNSEQAVFYAQYSSVYANGMVTWELTSVRNLSLTPKMLSEYLSSTAGAGTYFQYPGIGVPVLAVYRGTAAGDKEIRIGLGDVVHGSRLGSVNITCSISAMGVYSSTPRVGASAYSFPGRYMAISGDRGSYGEEGHICLFVRIE